MTERVWVVLAVGTALAAFPHVSAAEVYRWVDAHGAVTYSDRPQPPSEVVAPAPEPVSVRKATPAAPPVEPARTGPATVEELLELSGLKAQLAGIASRLAGQLQPTQGQMSLKDQTAVDRILARAVSHDKIYALVRDELRRDVDRVRLEATVAWLRSPVARKIAALEVASSEPATEQKIGVYAASLKANPPPAPRVELLQKLDWISGAAETSADIVAAVTRSVSKAVSATSPPAQSLRPGQIESRAEEIRTRVSESIRQAQLVSMLYTYQSLEDAELAEYVRFSASDAGRWYNARMHKALVSAVGGVVERATAELVRAVPPERWTRAPESTPSKAQ